MPYFIRRSSPKPRANPPPIDPSWQSFLDVAPVMIWICDPDGRLLLANAAWQKATGRTAADTSPAIVQELVHPADREKLTGSDTPFNGRPDSFEYRLRHADGSFRWVQECIHPWRSPTGDLFGYIGSTIDIHAQREHADELAQIALHQTSLTHFSRMVIEERSIRKSAMRRCGSFARTWGCPPPSCS